MPRLSSAHAISLLALFFALGGGAVAVESAHDSGSSPTFVSRQGPLKAIGSDGTASSTARCKRGERVSGGGWSSSGGAVVESSQPTGLSRAWTVSATNPNRMGTVAAIAICVK